MGEDTDVKVFNAETSRPVSQFRVFQDQPIHGISVQQDASLPSSGGKILLWGAKAVVVISLHGLENGRPTILASGTAPDWIYHGMLSPYDTYTAVFATAHNELVRATFDGDTGVLNFKEVRSPARPILYSADLVWLAKDCILVAGGTAFGEILVWKCYLNQTSTISEEVLFILTGHEGSIFGVNISPIIRLRSGTSARLLASCSDDRTIRIWDITERFENKGIYGKDSFNAPRETGFEVPLKDRTQDAGGSNAPITVAMGHLSRIWAVRFKEPEATHQQVDRLQIYSFGEDSTTQIWDLKLDSQLKSDGRVGELTGSLDYRRTLTLHDGKHIWSQAVYYWHEKNKLLIATGGADSRVSLIEEPLSEEATSMEIENISITSPFRKIRLSDVCKTANSLKPGSSGAETLWQYSFVTSDELLVTTTHGRLFVGSFAGRDIEWSEILVDLALTIDLAKAYILRKITGRAVLLATASGNLYLVDVVSKNVTFIRGFQRKVAQLSCLPPDSETEASQHVLVHFLGSATPAYLIFDPTTGLVEDERLVYGIDSRFVATSASKIDDYLILGSRHGWLSIFILKGKEYNQIFEMPPRSDDSITSIIPLPKISYSKASASFVTTSRDGKYRMYEFEHEEKDVNALELIHESSPPFGPMIEGGWFTKGPSPELILYGFRSKCFVIWNETLREERMCVDCGGAHRIFNLHHQGSDIAKARFAFTKKSELLIYSQHQTSHRPIKTGTHGREIRSLAPFGGLLASGSEDTTIRIWKYEKSLKEGFGEMRCLAYNDYHVVGLQKVKWASLDSASDSTASSSYLFSSSGNELFYVWKVRSIGVLGVGIMCEAVFDDKSKEGDLRILDFGVRPLSGEDGFCIIMAFSDSTLAAYTYHSVGGFQLLARSLYTGACLTHIIPLGSLEDNLPTITASTDGHFVIWKLSQTDDLKRQWAIQKIVNVHQNSIKCMQVAMKKDKTDYTVVTGGDDNGLGVTTLNVEDYEVTSQHMVKNAHTASINGLDLIQRAGYTIAFTTGNDQRIKVWKVAQEETARIELCADEYSGVADTSDLAIIEEDGKVVICGVGTEIWSIDG